MQRTPLFQKHVDLGARMVDFAGFEMPVYYSSIREEHLIVRNSCGMFDVSHMGEFIVKGKEALQLVQSITSNDVSKLEIGDAQYSCLPNDTGGIVDDLLVYRLDENQCSEGEQAFMLVVNGANITKDWNWILAKNTFDTRLIDISDKTSLLAVQGPKTIGILQELTDVDLSAIPYYKFVKGTFAGVENVIISATGYTGSGGLELYIEEDKVVDVWNAIMALPAEIKPIGLGARDTLRLEMGFCLYGNDITDQTSPLEAGLSWITKLKNTPDFSSKDILVKQKKRGLKNRLVGFKINDRRVPRNGYPIFDQEMKLIGKVTSGTLSPNLETPIGMGYVNKAFRKAGTKLKIQAGKRILNAEVCKLPFVEV